MKLITMTDFAIHKNSKVEDYRKVVFNYAKFLKTPLSIEMFDYESDKCLFRDCEITKRSTYNIVTFKEATIWLTWTKRDIESLIEKNLELTHYAVTKCHLDTN